MKSNEIKLQYFPSFPKFILCSAYLAKLQNIDDKLTQLFFADQVNLTTTKDASHTRCNDNHSAWLKLISEANSVAMSPSSLLATLSGNATYYSLEIPLKKPCLDDSHDLDSEVKSGETSSSRSTTDGDSHLAFVFNSILDVLNWLSQGRDLDLGLQNSAMTLESMPSILKEASHVQVLVTGSTHSVGGVLGLLTSDMNDN